MGDFVTSFEIKQSTTTSSTSKIPNITTLVLKDNDKYGKYPTRLKSRLPPVGQV